MFGVRFQPLPLEPLRHASLGVSSAFFVACSGNGNVVHSQRPVTFPKRAQWGTQIIADFGEVAALGRGRGTSKQCCIVRRVRSKQGEGYIRGALMVESLMRQKMLAVQDDQHVNHSVNDYALLTGLLRLLVDILLSQPG